MMSISHCFNFLWQPKKLTYGLHNIFTCTLTRFICISIASVLCSQSPRDHTLFANYVHIVYHLVCGGRGSNPSRDRPIALKQRYRYTAWKNTLIQGNSQTIVRMEKSRRPRETCPIPRNSWLTVPQEDIGAVENFQNH